MATEQERIKLRLLLMSLSDGYTVTKEGTWISVPMVELARNCESLDIFFTRNSEVTEVVLNRRE